MHIIMLLVILAVIGFTAYGGYHAGLYGSAYGFVRDMIAFLLAMTFCEPGTRLVLKVVPNFELHPGPVYLRVILLVLFFALPIGIAGWLKRRFLNERVETFLWVDRISGAALGIGSGVVITGFILIMYAMLPFVKYIPGDFGRIRTESLPLDTGALMLRYYGYAANRMGGSATFLVEPEPVLQENARNHYGYVYGAPGTTFKDLNGNNRWDRGWLWRYRHHADITIKDVERARSTKKTVYE